MQQTQGFSSAVVYPQRRTRFAQNQTKPNNVGNPYDLRLRPTEHALIAALPFPAQQNLLRAQLDHVSVWIAHVCLWFAHSREFILLALDELATRCDDQRHRRIDIVLAREVEPPMIHPTS